MKFIQIFFWESKKITKLNKRVGPCHTADVANELPVYYKCIIFQMGYCPIFGLKLSSSQWNAPLIGQLSSKTRHTIVCSSSGHRSVSIDLPQMKTHVIVEYFYYFYFSLHFFDYFQVASLNALNSKLHIKWYIIILFLLLSFTCTMNNEQCVILLCCI